MSFLSKLFGIDGAKNAASNAANLNRAESNSAYADAQSIQSPYYQGGQQGFNTLNNFLGINGQGAQSNAYQNYQQGPDVQFRMNQGINALDNSYAARTGGTDSGALRKAQINYGTGVATQDLSSYLARLAGVAGAGQTAANQMQGARYGSAGLTTGANTAEGNAIANASLAGGNMLAGGLGAIAGLAGNLGGFGGFNPFSSGQGAGQRNQQQGTMTGNRYW